MNEQRSVKKPSNIIMENRKSMTVSGITDMGNFDDQTVTAYTDFGMLTVKGSGLHISKLSVETGELAISGEISMIAYSDSAGKKATGVLAKIFR
ncbi:MAG: sporulation protein YabP [Ruminococcaceae bacterium]|nr:sporulation protein YabP [Oscillospiraceae bacterium]